LVTAGIGRHRFDEPAGTSAPAASSPPPGPWPGARGAAVTRVAARSGAGQPGQQRDLVSGPLSRPVLRGAPARRRVPQSSPGRATSM